jgi:eukaryotic-like serine/threonine-protein kinase
MSSLVPGTVVAGRYRLDRLLGQGGMGVVWAATHTITRRSVAMKFLRGPAHARPEMRRRFLREARVASAVKHPSVVEVHDVFELDDETPVMVMDLLVGRTLAERLDSEGILSLGDTASILLPVVSAVGTAHARGVVHRDLKPENIFLAQTDEGRIDVKVLDFGIAKLANMDGEAVMQSQLTGTGSLLGTPCYSSPEQLFGEREIDHGADIWAIGVVLYECLSGQLPVYGENLGQVLKVMTTGHIVPIEHLVPGLPDDMVLLVGRMLSRPREDRPSDMREVLDVLKRYSTVPVREFGAAKSTPPSRDTPQPSDDKRPKTPVHPPDGPTLVAGTPVRQDTASPHAVSRADRQDSRKIAIFAGVALAALVVGGVGWQLGRSRNGAVLAPSNGIQSAATPSIVIPSIPVAPAAETMPPPLPEPVASVAPRKVEHSDKSTKAKPAAAKADGGARAEQDAAKNPNQKRTGGLIEDVPF